MFAWNHNLYILCMLSGIVDGEIYVVTSRKKYIEEQAQIYSHVESQVPNSCYLDDTGKYIHLQMKQNYHNVCCNLRYYIRVNGIYLFVFGELLHVCVHIFPCVCVCPNMCQKVYGRTCVVHTYSCMQMTIYLRTLFFVSSMHISWLYCLNICYNLN